MRSKKNGRYYCDICKKIIPKEDEGRKFRDAIEGDVLDVCSPKCARNEFERRYQLDFLDALTSPSSNTGVAERVEPCEDNCLFPVSCQQDSAFCILGEPHVEPI